jgi:hypothetical protein
MQESVPSPRHGSRLSAAHGKRLERLAAAFDAYRRANPGGRFPAGLRVQVVSAIDAGVSAGAVGRACRLSWSQLRSWQQAAAGGGRVAAPARLDAVVSPRVLSVVDGPREALLEGDDIELRVGRWWVSLRRVVD